MIHRVDDDTGGVNWRAKCTKHAQHPVMKKGKGHDHTVS